VQRHQLEHLIRAAGTITDRYEFVVVGSQSILGSVERPPIECLFSNEADIFPLGAEELSDAIDGAIGEGSQFHETYGFYAQGVDSSTAVLPTGWQGRVSRLQTEGTEGRVAYCIHVLDLFMAKCVAARDKDRDFNIILLRAGLVHAEAANALVPAMPVNQAARGRLLSFIARLDETATAAGPL
jgi:hypothetical protein